MSTAINTSTRPVLRVQAAPEKVWVARFPGVKHEWIVMEGDPRDRSRMNYLGCQELRRGGRLAESWYSGGAADQITSLREVDNLFIGITGKRDTSVFPEHDPSDNDPTPPPSRTVTLTDNAYRALCGLVHPSLNDEDVEADAATWTELQVMFPFADRDGGAA